MATWYASVRISIGPIAAGAAGIVATSAEIARQRWQWLRPSRPFEYVAVDKSAVPNPRSSGQSGDESTTGGIPEAAEQLGTLKC